ncbi:ferrochelatase [Effusibacillus dendaii]|uniref:Coproporphyrin III ferrochelatase n=1 Tax=Effusibacillus dendaii TaxID=2743772 RepID=A0A7I8DA87_9BACL|nr:ferrochelatase [Effusibacillus dendaii]BCJ86887.1 ferrochelatase 1 [Effusibacillus dendaii]
MSNQIGVLAMAYGTPESLEQVEAYYTHIRRGHKPTPELLNDLTERYRRIGGVSPLNEITKKQTEGLERLLNESRDGVTYRVYTGMKHNNPFIEDTVKQMADDGIQKAVGIVLAPHYSSMSVGTYISAAEKGAAEHGTPAFTFVREWHLHPLFLNGLEKRLLAALKQFSDAERENLHVLFTAHSLPERILQLNDPYPNQLTATASALAERIEQKRWSFAWQSAGRTADPWLGPDVLDVLRELKEQGVRNVIISAIGFVADHLEVLYDIDIECQGLAKELGIKLLRTAMFNADADFLQTLASVVREQAKKEGLL